MFIKRPLSYFARKVYDQQVNLSREEQSQNLAWSDAVREAAAAARHAGSKA